MYHIGFEQVALMPRERLIEVGAEKLSHQELLAILIRTGTKNKSVGDIAEQILKKVNSLADLRDLSLEELQRLAGIGRVKAIEIKAMIELGRRINHDSIRLDESIKSSEKLARQMIQELGSKKQEHLVALYLNTQNQVIRKETIFIGSVLRSIAEPREILHYALKCMATSIVIVHNHPSGSVKPSKQDEIFTGHIKKACELLGLVLLDHLIVGSDKYYSFREKGTLSD